MRQNDGLFRWDFPKEYFSPLRQLKKSETCKEVKLTKFPNNRNVPR